MERNTIMAISLWQPWATLVAIGAKRIETRGWSPWYRGALVIHASKRFAVPERDLCDWPIFKVALARGGYASWKDLPLGAAVCLTELREVHRTEDLLARGIVGDRGQEEREFGDYRGERYGWLLGEPRRFSSPIPFSGAQGFFKIPADVVQNAWNEPVAAPAPPPAVVTPADRGLFSHLDSSASPRPEVLR
jgi:hypothetical protein